MKRTVGITLLFALLVGCGKGTDHRGRTPLAEAEGQFLYLEDLRKVMPVDLSKEDSLLFSAHYIREWIEEVLLFKKAEGNIPDNAKIDRLVENYRRSLMVYAYQEELIQQKLANTISDKEIADYYRDHKNLFRLEQPLLKGLFVKVPLNAPKIADIRRWYQQKTQDAMDHIEKYSVGNATAYDYFYDQWKPVEELIAKIPLSALREDAHYLDNHRNIEVQDTSFYYFLHVEELLKKDDIEPLDFARDDIKNLLIHSKQIDFMRDMKAELYDQASKRNAIKYYYLDTKESLYE